MRALVAGGAGFIGSNLSERLLESGHEVICVDNLITGRLKNIGACMEHVAFRFVDHDLVTGLPSLPAVDWIFHLASPASPPGYQAHALETMRVNSEGTLRLLDLAANYGATFLFASTSEVYGDPLQHPQREHHRGNVDPVGPRSMYDEAKRYGEALTALYEREHRVDTRIMRIFNTYGPGSDPEDGRMVPNFITQALRNQPLTVYGTGRQTRSFCFVADLVEGLIQAVECPEARGEVINLGNPEEHDILEFAEKIRDLCGSAAEIEFKPGMVGDDPRRRRPDIGKALSLLGWQPRVGLEEGLLKTIDYFAQEIRAPARTRI